MGKQQLSVLKKLMPYLRRRMPALVANLLLAAIHVAMSLYIPILVGRAIDCIIDAGRVDFAAMKGQLLGVLICAGVAVWMNVGAVVTVPAWSRSSRPMTASGPMR